MSLKVLERSHFETDEIKISHSWLDEQNLIGKRGFKTFASSSIMQIWIHNASKSNK